MLVDRRPDHDDHVLRGADHRRVHGGPQASGRHRALEQRRGTRLVERVLESSSPSLESARMIGLQATTAPYIVFLTEHDVPTPELLDTLVRAQQSSGADVCSCGFYVEDDDRGRTLRLFTGEPRGLGLIANAYGQVALLRRSLLTDFTAPWPVEGDADWPLLARLSTRGAKIVSVPVPLLTRAFHPGTIGRDPTAALQVVEQFEASLPAGLRERARLAAGLAAASLQASAQDGGLSSPREQGFGALAVRAGRRLTRRRR